MKTNQYRPKEEESPVQNVSPPQQVVAFHHNQ